MNATLAHADRTIDGLYEKLLALIDERDALRELCIRHANTGAGFQLIAHEAVRHLRQLQRQLDRERAQKRAWLEELAKSDTVGADRLRVFEQNARLERENGWLRELADLQADEIAATWAGAFA